MAKAKTSNKKVAKSGGRLASLKAWGKKHKVITSLLVIALLFGVYYGVRASYEWTQFKLAERKVDSLYALTIEKLGEPEKKSFESSCGHASAKFHQGALGCGYGGSLTYKVKNVDEANKIANEFADLIEDQKEFKLDYASQKSPVDLMDEKNNKERMEYEQSASFVRLPCSFEISLVGDDGYFLPNAKNNWVKIRMSCDKSPLIKSIYPELD